MQSPSPSFPTLPSLEQQISYSSLEVDRTIASSLLSDIEDNVTRSVGASTQPSNFISKPRIKKSTLQSKAHESVDCEAATHAVTHGQSSTSVDAVDKRIRRSSRRQASEEAQQIEKQLEKKEKQRRRDLMSQRRQMQSQLALTLGLQKENHESEPDATDGKHDSSLSEGICQFLLFIARRRSQLQSGTWRSRERSWAYKNFIGQRQR